MSGNIISPEESRLILEKTHRHRLTQKYAEQLKTASPEEREKLEAQIETEVQKKMKVSWWESSIFNWFNPVP